MGIPPRESCVLVLAEIPLLEFDCLLAVPCRRCSLGACVLRVPLSRLFVCDSIAMRVLRRVAVSALSPPLGSSAESACDCPLASWLRALRVLIPQCAASSRACCIGSPWVACWLSLCRVCELSLGVISVSCWSCVCVPCGGVCECVSRAVSAVVVLPRACWLSRVRASR